MFKTKKMVWTILNFGKHKGKSLPQILFSDPDWFFWSLKERIWDNKPPTIKKEVETIKRRSKSIKIPSNIEKKLIVEYLIHSPTLKFTGFRIIQSDTSSHTGSTVTFRTNALDMSKPYEISSYDKFGNKIFLDCFKTLIAKNSNLRFTKKYCEDFFSSEANFIAED